jgi:hypothetical protein
VVTDFGPAIAVGIDAIDSLIHHTVAVVIDAIQFIVPTPRIVRAGG